MGIGSTCGYLDVESVQYTLVPFGVAPDAYIFIRVHLFRCSIWFEPLFNIFTVCTPEIFLLPGNTLSKRVKPDITWTTVIPAKFWQTVDVVHVE